MAMLAQTSLHPRAPNAGFEFSFPYRRFERPEGGGNNTSQRLDFTVKLTPHGSRETGSSTGTRETASLRAAMAFLVDATYGAVTAATLAQMIGRYFFTTGAAPGVGKVTVSLDTTHGDNATMQVTRPSFEVERTGFGAAHILHEDDTLGLYILEIAPHGAIPAHCHQVMRESELILDDGLLQQGRPVARGSAFAWPLGHIHAYRNPTGRPRRILCVDSPRFMPEDEVPLAAAPRLVPLAPLVNYLD
jgi:mannose-6-phosphate isomerase-like protein (cupin superfamily)